MSFYKSPQLRAFSLINNKKTFKMPKNLKYLKYFKSYIAEQDFTADTAADGNVSAAPKEPIFSFIFLVDDDKNKPDYTYPDGSSAKTYSTYEIKKQDLDIWITDNIVEGEGLAKSAVKVKRKAFLEFISGVKSSVTPDDKQYVEKFKNAVVTGSEGKKIQDTEVIFSPKEDKPSTDSVDVTFIRLPKK